jgi:tRNA A-37 threonylcarbamoyl transferase component Bud32
MPQLEDACTAVNGTIGCCHIVSYTVQLGQYRLAVFETGIIMLTLFSILFLLFKLRSTLEIHISLYYNFVLLATFTYVAVVVINLLPKPAADGSALYYAWLVVYLSVLASQWFIQLGVAVFMTRSTDTQAPDHTDYRVSIFIAASGSVALAIICIVAVALAGPTSNMRWIGLTIVQGILMITFSVFALSRTCCKSCFVNIPRPGAVYWSVFQLIAHTLYFLEYLFFIVAPMDTPVSGHCMEIVANSYYYALYAMMLFFVIRLDSKFWRMNSALLHSVQNFNIVGISTAEKQRKINSLVNRGLTIIKWRDLTIMNYLGSGNFADVFEGSWKKTKVAIKKLKVPPNEEEQREILNDLIKESTLLSKLRHPNVVLFLGLCTEAPNFAMVTEYMSRGSLWSILHPGGVAKTSSAPLDWSQRIHIMKGIARGMNFLHNSDPPIIHRDLKSQNVLVDENWNCKVADFGMSRLKTLTATMTRVGTPQWMAPEILREERYDETADVWSFGVVCWELITGEAPFFGQSPLRVVSMVAHQGIKLQIPPNCPAAMAKLIERCFQESRLRPSFPDLLEYLDDISPDEIAVFPHSL